MQLLLAIVVVAVVRAGPCPAGRYSGFVLQASGPCAEGVTSAAECRVAATALELHETNPVTTFGGDDVPPGCQYNGNSLGFSTDTSDVSPCRETLNCVCKSCVPCASGTYAAGAATRAACEGTACAAGHAGAVGATSVGSTACVACTPGRFAAKGGGSSCALCPAGRQSSVASVVCALCPSGRHEGYALQAAATCNVAVATEEECIAAAVELKLPGVSSDTHVWSFSGSPPGCSASPGGTLYFNQRISATVCSDSKRCICRSCVACASGTFAAAAGVRAVCDGEACPAGKAGALGSTSAAAATCAACAAGQFAALAGTSNCIACPVGQSSEPGRATSCTVCPAGRSHGFFTRNSGHCTTLVGSAKECEAAASALVMSDTTVRALLDSREAPGCSVSSSYSLVFNRWQPSSSSSSSSEEGECSDSKVRAPSPAGWKCCEWPMFSPRLLNRLLVFPTSFCLVSPSLTSCACARAAPPARRASSREPRAQPRAPAARRGGRRQRRARSSAQRAPSPRSRTRPALRGARCAAQPPAASGRRRKAAWPAQRPWKTAPRALFN